MRIVLYNPHIDSFFGVSVYNYLIHARQTLKYKYFLEYLINNNKDFVLFVNASSVPYIGKYIPKKLEIFFYALVNNFNPHSLPIITDPNMLTNNDVFFTTATNILNDDRLVSDVWADKKMLKVFHLTHYFFHTKLLALNFKKVEGDFLIAENNLTKNSLYFQYYFPYYKKDVYLLPLVYGSRFVRSVPFLQRKNKCVGTGTILALKEFPVWKNQFGDFVRFFHSDVLQPFREVIFDKKDELSELIDCLIARFWEIRKVKTKNKILTRFLNTFYAFFFSGQNNYRKFDIVAKYNEYRMFIVPEEVIDLPATSFVEGMACGCAYIGKIDPMYTDLGMQPGVHYIGYNGTLRDLKQKIVYYQKHTEELEKIANAGYALVREKFNAETVAEKFYTDLEELSDEYKRRNYRKNDLRFRSVWN